MTIPARHTARYALVLLFSVNLLNYVDRQIIYAIFPLIKALFNNTFLLHRIWGIVS